MPACILRPHCPQQFITTNDAAPDTSSQNSSLRKASEASLRVFAKNLRGMSRDDRLAELLSELSMMDWDVIVLSEIGDQNRVNMLLQAETTCSLAQVVYWANVELHS